MSAEIVAGIILKACGAAAGAFLAIVFALPKTMTDFLTRASISLVSGIVFAPQVADYLRWADSDETTLSSATLAAFVSWWVCGSAVKLAGLGAWFAGRRGASETDRQEG